MDYIICPECNGAKRFLRMNYKIDVCQTCKAYGYIDSSDKPNVITPSDEELSKAHDIIANNETDKVIIWKQTAKKGRARKA